MKRGQEWKTWAYSAIIITMLAGGLLLLELYLGPSNMLIPDEAHYARIISVEHEESVKKHCDLQLNITFTFYNGFHIPNVSQYGNFLARRLEIFIWKDIVEWNFDYVVQNIQLNATFPRVGEWTVRVNVGYDGQQSTVDVC